MKKLLAFLFLFFISTFSIARGGGKGGDVSVRGYYRSNGTYVQPHMRSAPDGDFNNNWTTKGNINPYTSEPGTKIAPSNGSGAGYSLPLLDSNSGSTTSNENQQGWDTGVSTPSYQSQKLEKGVSQLPANAKVNYLGNDWDCISGYRRDGNTCTRVIFPENARLNYLGNGWECIHGYRQVGKQCMLVLPPDHAKLNYLGNGWECERGYRQLHDKCTQVQVTENARLNYIGNGWECVHGYRVVGSQCIQVLPPEHAKLNYLGNGWECVYGYRRAGEQCVEVTIPANAKLNYLGNGWQCEAGYRQVKNGCVPDQ